MRLHIARECGLRLQEQKQMNDNYATLSHTKDLDVPPTSYLGAKQVYGLIDQNALVLAPKCTFQTDEPTPRLQGNG